MTIEDLKFAGLVLLIWGPWPVLAAIGQWQRGGNIGHGFVVGLLFGPLGLLVANYSGGRTCPACMSKSVKRGATRCPKCGAAVPAA